VLLARKRQRKDLARIQRRAAAACLGTAAVVIAVKAALEYTGRLASPDFLQGVLWGVEIGVLALAVLLLSASRRQGPQRG
jgi:hypothetical protein